MQMEAVMTSETLLFRYVHFTNLFSNQVATMHFTYLVLEKVYSTSFGNPFHIPCIRLHSSVSQSICIQFVFPRPVKHCRNTKDAQAQTYATLSFSFQGALIQDL